MSWGKCFLFFLLDAIPCSEVGHHSYFFSFFFPWPNSINHQKLSYPLQNQPSKPPPSWTKANNFFAIHFKNKIFKNIEKKSSSFGYLDRIVLRFSEKHFFLFFYFCNCQRYFGQVTLVNWHQNIFYGSKLLSKEIIQFSKNIHIFSSDME